MQLVCIYNGPGTADVQDYVIALKQVLACDYTIELVNSVEIIQQNPSSVRLWVMPGGADRPYLKHLKKQGNEALIQFVKGGGCYLGICAGAYYGSSQILFDVGTHQEINASRPLKFFEGLAQGPILQPYFYNEPKGITCAKIFLSKHIFSHKAQKNQISKSYSYLYYNGGPCFLPYNTTSEILAWYKKENNETWYLNTKAIQLPAIVYRKLEKGHIILSGLHLENPLFDPYNTSKNYSRIDLLKHILGIKMGLKLKPLIYNANL